MVLFSFMGFLLQRKCIWNVPGEEISGHYRVRSHFPPSDLIHIFIFIPNWITRTGTIKQSHAKGGYQWLCVSPSATDSIKVISRGRYFNKKGQTIVGFRGIHSCIAHCQPQGVPNCASIAGYFEWKHIVYFGGLFETPFCTFVLVINLIRVTSIIIFIDSRNSSICYL